MTKTDLISLYLKKEIRSVTKNKYVKLILFTFSSLVCYFSIYTASFVINKNNFTELVSNGSFLCYSFIGILLLRIFFQNPPNFDLFTLKKLGISENHINSVFPIVSQINLYNVFFAVIGSAILIEWKEYQLTVDILMLLLTVLSTNLINIIIKYLIPKYFIIFLIFISIPILAITYLGHISFYYEKYLKFYVLLFSSGFIALNILVLKCHRYTLSYDYYSTYDPQRKLFQMPKSLTWSWTIKDFLLILRVNRMKSLWIGFSLIIFIYTSYTNRSYNENSTYPFFYTLFSLIFLTSYYGQNYISWDSSSLSIVLFTNDKIKINKYINGKYLTMALLTSISFIVLLIINIIRLSLNIELIKLTILYIYSTICLPPLYLYFGLSNNFKINLREKSILSHWDDKSSIPQLSFLIFIAFTCLTYFIFDLTNTADYAYVFFLILSLVTLSIKHSLVKFLVLKILKKKQILFEKLISI